jgi:SPP1 gp7 family putative phage head morphogenesis protein
MRQTVKKKTLKPIIYRDAWHSKITKEIKQTLAATIYEPLLEAVDEAEVKENAKPTALEQALMDGRVQYVNGTFTGKMSAALSKEIKALGGRFVRGKWRLQEPQMNPSLKKAIDKNKSMLKRLSDGITRRLTEMAENARNAIEGMSIASLGIYAMDRTSDEFKRTVAKEMSVQPQASLKADGRTLLSADYTETRDKPIKQRLSFEMDQSVKEASRNFAYGEIVKLREELEQMVSAGTPRQDVRDYIKARLGVSDTRAKFIARQETSLYTSKLKEAQYKGAGIEQYRWKTAGDVRVRHDHRALNNKTFSWDNPPVVDERTGRKGHPGEDFNCRCIAVPIVEW